jgi:predicted porin
MKRVLFGTTGLATAFLTASTAAIAADGIKLSVGGYFKQAYMIVADDDDEGEPGFNRNINGFFNDAEIHFVGSTVLDNGLEVGARVELEGETDSPFDSDLETNGGQIDEAWIWFSGGWGELRIGAEDEALANACITPPGGTGNFSAFSPNQWGANADRDVFHGFAAINSSNTVCTGVDDSADAQKLVYISPLFGGFQLTASYTPESSTENNADGGGPHLGMPETDIGASRHNVSAYLTYQYEGADWGITAGLGGSWEGKVEDEFVDPLSIAEQDFYQAGVTLSFGNFSVGIAGEYFYDISTGHTDDEGNKTDSWSAGIGAAYVMDAWTFGAQYSHRRIRADIDFNGVDSDHWDIDQDRAVLTAIYALGPGITVDGELGYTWLDTDPAEDIFFEGNSADHYDAFEIGIGTSLTF